MVNAALQESSAIVEKPDAGKELKSDVEKTSSVIRSRNARMKRGTERNWGALFKKFCKRDFCDEVRDFKIPEPEAVAS